MVKKLKENWAFKVIRVQTILLFSGVSDLQEVKILIFPLTLLVIATTVPSYWAACDQREIRRLITSSGFQQTSSSLTNGVKSLGKHSPMNASLYESE